MWDMDDFYEAMHRDTLQERRRKTGLPAFLSTIARDMYACRRMIRHGEVVNDVGRPTRGIPAGCAAATFHVQAYLSEDTKQWATRNLHLGVNIHIDDVTVYGSTIHPTMLAKRMTDRLHDMRRAIEENGNASCHGPKWLQSPAQQQQAKLSRCSSLA